MLLEKGKKSSGRFEIRNQVGTEAELYFYGDIVSTSEQSQWCAEDKAPNDIVELLRKVDGVKTLHIRFNSCGGAVFAGEAIGQELERFKQRNEATLIGYIDGIAASIAGVILMYCDKIQVYRGSMFMMHKPLVFCFGNADDLRKEIEILDKCEKNIIDIYMRKTKEGVTKEVVTELVNKESWLTADEMAQYFDIEINGSDILVASCQSEYIEKYKRVPKDLLLKQKTEQKYDEEVIEKIVTSIIDRVTKGQEETEKEIEKETEQQREELLKDLELI